MTASGGIYSLAYIVLTMLIITVFTVLHGARGGIAFIVFTVASGGLFSLLIQHDILLPAKEPTTAFFCSMPFL